MVTWLLCRISRRWIAICFQPWCNPMWLTGLKAPTSKLTMIFHGNKHCFQGILNQRSLGWRQHCIVVATFFFLKNSTSLMWATVKIANAHTQHILQSDWFILTRSVLLFLSTGSWSLPWFFHGYEYCVQGILKSTQSGSEVRRAGPGTQPILVQPAAVSSEFEVTGESSADLRDYMTAIQDLDSSEDISMPPKKEHRPRSVVVVISSSSLLL